MNEKKHIDELFKEQLQNYEAAPSPAVWNNIQAELKKEKEDRKVIPIWWKLAGVAAVIALLLTVGNVYFNSTNPSIDKTIVNEEGPSEIDNNDSTFIKKQDAVVENASKEESNSTLEDQKEDSENDPSKYIQNKIVSPTHSKENGIADADNVSEEKNKRSDLIKNEVSVSTENSKEAVAESMDHKNGLENNDKSIINSKEGLQENDRLIKNKSSETIGLTTQETGIVTSDKTKAQKNKLNDRDPLIKKEGFEHVEAKEAVAKTDGTTNGSLNDKDEKPSTTEGTGNEGKSIFDAIEENKETAVAKVDQKDGRPWEVTPNVGPVFYNSLGDGSSIDPSFADNSQSSDVNFSYGVQVSYAINDRLSIRSGVSNVNLGYSTGGIELGDSPVEAALQSVNFEGRTSGRVLSAFDKGTLSNLPPPVSGDPLAFVTPKRTGGNAEIIQNLSYYEVPMELNYALVDKRIGVHMIGGFSTLFLGDNEVSVQDGDFREVLGEANNLNSVSFTTNVGLGFNYKISEKLKFNIEPMFKYQLNPYADSSVDFRPYYVGIYSGLSLKF